MQTQDNCFTIIAIKEIREKTLNKGFKVTLELTLLNNIKEEVKQTITQESIVDFDMEYYLSYFNKRTTNKKNIITDTFQLTGLIIEVNIEESDFKIIN